MLPVLLPVCAPSVLKVCFEHVLVLLAHTGALFVAMRQFC